MKPHVAHSSGERCTDGADDRIDLTNAANQTVVALGEKAAGELKLSARAEDAAGNVEKLPHVVVRVAP